MIPSFRRNSRGTSPWEWSGGLGYWQHATRRLRQWLCRKHKVRSAKHVRFPDEMLWKEYGLTRLTVRTARFPWAKA